LTADKLSRPEIRFAPAKQGYIIDFITGKHLKLTAEERVRQQFEHILVEEYGYPKAEMDIEFKIQRGAAKGKEKADIVVFNDASHKEQANIKIIVETEPPSHEFDDQLLSYVTATTAQFCVWTNGAETKYFYRPVKAPTKLDPITQFPHWGETINDIGRHLKKDLRPSNELKLIFESIHNALFASANIRRAEKLGAEMIKLLFCKIHDERSPNVKCQFRATVEEIIDEDGNERVLARVKKLFTEVKVDFKDVFDQNDELLLDAESVAMVVGRLQRISLLRSETDVVGEAFEVFIPEEFKGEKGEFFTPRPVVRMTMQMLQLEPSKRERLIDPACGSGGFLIVGMEYAKQRIEQTYAKSGIGSEQIGKEKDQYARNHFFGIDVEADLARISKAYMAVVGDGRGGIFCEDSLKACDKWTEKCKDAIELGQFQVLATNPPFGTKIKVRSREILSQYDLAHHWSENDNQELVKSKRILGGQAPDILFLERCVKLLEPSGRMAIVLPRGTLNNPDQIVHRVARKWLLENCKILAVVDLPKDTFQPYTGTKTSVLFLERTPPPNDYSVFMAISKEIGHDKRHNPVYERTDDGSLILDEDNNPKLKLDQEQIVHAYLTGENSDPDRIFWSNIGDIRREDRLDASHFSPIAQKALAQITKATPPDWSLQSIGQLSKDVFYPGRFKRVYVKKAYGVPFYSGANITRHTPVGLKYLSKDTKNLDEYRVRKDWILVTRSGTSGVITYVDATLDNAAVSEHVIRIVPDTGRVDAGYLYAILSGELYPDILESAITGSMVDEITPSFIKSIKIPIPPGTPDEGLQKEIGEMIRQGMGNRYKARTLTDEARVRLLKIIHPSSQ